MKRTKREFNNPDSVSASTCFTQQSTSCIRHPVPNTAIPGVWKEKPEIVYHFLALKSHFEQLCREVAYILQRKLEIEGIEYSSITCRAKELESFLEKLERKKYDDPFNEITDFAGVRVVCLYPSDLARIEEIIRREFDTAEKIDKYRKNGENFGYMAVHYMVKLGSEYSGARYDHIKDLACEVQTRTVLQDAWALIDQHLVYKKTSQIPPALRTQVMELSRVLEEADRRFENIRQQREAYIQTLEHSGFESSFLEKEINLDSLRIFCRISFPDTPEETDRKLFYRVIKWLGYSSFRTIGDIHDAVTSVSDRFEYFMDLVETLYQRQGRRLNNWTNLDLVHFSLALADSDYRDIAGIPWEFYNIIEYLDQNQNEDLDLYRKRKINRQTWEQAPMVM